ncbi:MAG: site-specific DNA-methyltransferase, partial [Aminipila sp.]
YTSEKMDNCTLHNYNDGDLIACFDQEISKEVFEYIAKKQPIRTIFRDYSFADSPSKINVEELFKLHAKNTDLKVI